MTNTNELQRQINSLADRLRGLLATQFPPLVTYAGNPDTNLEAQAGTLCWDTANFDLYICISNPSGTDWQLLGGGSGASGAPISAQYLTLALNATLTGERRFVDGDGLTGTDGGANGDYTLAVALAADLLANLLGIVGGEIDLDTQDKNLVFASDSAADGQKPVFRAIAPADLPGAYLTAVLEGDGIDITGVDTVNLGMEFPLIWDGTNPPTEYTTLALAIAAASSGDTIWLPPGTYSGDHTIPESVTLAGMVRTDCILTGQITASNLSHVENLTIDRDEDTASDVYGLIGPGYDDEVAYAKGVTINVVNAGAGSAYAINVFFHGGFGTGKDDPGLEDCVIYGETADILR